MVGYGYSIEHCTFWPVNAEVNPKRAAVRYTHGRQDRKHGLGKMSYIGWA